MIIRATQKVLTLSGIKPLKNTQQPVAQLPGEWYVNLFLEIYTTNSRSMLAFMNQMKYGIEHHLMMAETPEDINYEEIEDIQLEYMFTKDGKARHYEHPNDILSGILKSQIKIN